MNYGKPTIEDKEEAQEKFPFNLEEYSVDFTDLDDASKNKLIKYILEAITK